MFVSNVQAPNYCNSFCLAHFDDLVSFAAGDNFCLAVSSEGLVYGFGSVVDGVLGLVLCS